MKTIMKGASILTAILMFSMVLTPVIGAPVLSFERFGTAYDDVGAPINTGLITSWIDGVQFGDDVTDASGVFSIDTVGDDTESTAVKTGGYVGDGDTIRYALGDLTGSTGQFFTETDTWSLGGSSGHDLNATASVDLLKIAIVSDDLGDYVALYNPTAGPVPIAGYDLQVGAGAVGAISIYPGLGAYNVDPIPAGDLLFCSLTLGAANSVQLYNGVNVIDRVEFGAIGAEPEDTWMSNAVSPTAGNEIYRWDGAVVDYSHDTNECAADFTSRASTLPIPVLTLITVTPDPVTITDIDVGSTPVSAQGEDQWSNPMGIAPTWTTTATSGITFTGVTPSVGTGPATASLDYDGTQIVETVTYRATDGIFDDATLDIIAYTPVLTLITVTPDPVTITDIDVGSTPVSAQGEDQTGAAMGIAPTWTTTATSGITFTGVTPSVGTGPATASLDYDGTQVVETVTYRATDGIFDDATLDIIAYTPVLTLITVTPDPVTITDIDVGSTPVSAQGEDQTGAAMGIAPTWTTTATSGITFSAVTPSVGTGPATASLDYDGTQVAETVTYRATDGIFDDATLQINTAGSGATPDFVWANKTGGVVRLEWSGGAAPFEIYISNNVDGTGFNFAAADDTTSNFWFEYNVLGDGTSYSYIVRGQGDATSSNMAFKFAKSVIQPGSPNINWVTLPYVYQHTTLEQVAIDIGDAITWEVRAWDPVAQTYRVVVYDDLFLSWGGDTAYAMSPGDAVLIFCRSPGTWDMVGAYNPSQTFNIIQPGSPNINWIGLPTNHNYGTLEDVALSIGDAITWEVRCWDPVAQTYRVVVYDDLFLSWGGDTAYAMSPEDAVLIFCRSPGVWAPTATNP